MFETSAEVLGGLIKAFRDYEQKNESVRGAGNCWLSATRFYSNRGSAVSLT